MSDVIKVNTSRLASDSDKILRCIENMESRAGAIEAELLRLASAGDDPEIAEIIASFRKGIKDLRISIEELERIHTYETEACSKYERCISYVDAVIEGIII